MYIHVYLQSPTAAAELIVAVVVADDLMFRKSVSMLIETCIRTYLYQKNNRNVAIYLYLICVVADALKFRKSVSMRIDTCIGRYLHAKCNRVVLICLLSYLCGTDDLTWGGYDS